MRCIWRTGTRGFRVCKGLRGVRRGVCLQPDRSDPDPIPVLGYLDDLILIPLGVALAARMIPVEVLEDRRQKARSAEGQPVNRTAAVFVVAVWAILAVLAIFLVRRW